MFDLTGNSLAGYMIRVIRDVVAHNPRFRNSLGEVSLAANNQVFFQDVQVMIRDITAQGIRQSFDYFIANQLGRTLVAKVGDKDGAFFEWCDEIDPSGVTPAAGAYMFNVDSVDEQTRKVGFTIVTYLWFEGGIKNAQGSKIYLAPGINGLTVAPYDTTTNLPVTFQPAANYIYLLSPCISLGMRDGNGQALTPLTDFWAVQQESVVILSPTVFGIQTATVPNELNGVQLFDQDQFELRPNIDYIVTSPTTVRLSAWTRAGMVITATGTVVVDPSIAGNAIHSENLLDIALPSGATLAPDHVYVATQDTNNAAVTITGNQISLVNPLPPGGWLRYDLRALVGTSTAIAKKMGSNVNLIPGLRIAIGDQVVVGDQCALLVSPHVTETYRVYGAKDSISFAIDVKANDPSTASDLAELLKRELLILRRDTIESDGLTIFEATRSTTSTQRDRSSTAASWMTTLQVGAMADWRVFVPLVNRITRFDIEIDSNPAQKYIPCPRYTTLRTFGFLPNY